MEILFPDVVGSGGAPKRITKPRRKGTDSMIEGDEIDDTPGTNVLNLLGADNSLFQSTPIQTPIQPPTVPSNGTVRPTSTTMPPRTSIASSSALTPPDEVPTEHAQTGNTRKRYLGSNNGAGPSSTSEKRRRTANNNYIDLTHSAQLANPDNPFQLGSNGAAPTTNGNVNTSNTNGSTANHSNNNSQQLAQQNPHSATAPTTNGVTGSSNTNPTGGGAATNRTQHFQDAMIVIAEQIRAQQRLVGPGGQQQPAAPPNWPQQAMEVFFRDFGDEEMDLQIKIGEKVLCDNNKAMMFCMMPEDLRRHWVKRLRELHNLNGGGGGSSRGDINIPGPGMPNGGGVGGGGGGGGMMAAVPGMQMGGPMGGQNPMMRNGSQIG